jgi:hypothetical protein
VDCCVEGVGIDGEGEVVCGEGGCTVSAFTDEGINAAARAILDSYREMSETERVAIFGEDGKIVAPPGMKIRIVPWVKPQVGG